MKHRTYIPERLVIEAEEGGFLLSLAFFAKLKVACSHGHFKTIEEAAKRTGIRRSTAARHIKVLLQEGYLTKEESSYKIIKRVDLSKKGGIDLPWLIHSCTLIFNTNDKLSTIAHLLRVKHIELLDRQQKYLTSDFNLADFSRAALKKKLKKYAKLGFDETLQRRLKKIKYKELTTSTGFTYEWLAEKTKTSKSSAFRTMQLAKERGICKTEVLSIFLQRASYNDWKMMKAEIRLQHPSSFYCFKTGTIRYNVCTLFQSTSPWSLD